MSSKLIPDPPSAEGRPATDTANTVNPGSLRSSTAAVTEPIVEGHGNGEFHDVDTPPVVETTAGDVSLSRGMFDVIKDTLTDWIKATGVKMADNSRSKRMCSACEMFPAIAHQPGHVTCECVCHRTRELLATLESI